MEYYILAEASGVARGILETLKKIWILKKKIECHPQGTHGFPKKC